VLTVPSSGRSDGEEEEEDDDDDNVDGVRLRL
jgi:hypothetical protein